MADRDIAAIVADLRADVTEFRHGGWIELSCRDVLAVLDDWQRQADEIARLKQRERDLTNEAIGLHEALRKETAERDAALAEVEALRAAVGREAALIETLEAFTDRLSKPSDLHRYTKGLHDVEQCLACSLLVFVRAALDRALAEPTEAETAETTYCRRCAGTGEYPPTGGTECSWCYGEGEVVAKSTKET